MSNSVCMDANTASELVSMIETGGAYADTAMAQVDESGLSLAEVCRVAFPHLTKKAAKAMATTLQTTYTAQVR